MATDAEWAAAYAAQALSDLDARELLIDAERCHRLHFLQMATEKLCKAYLVALNGEESLSKSHAYIESVLPQMARSFAGLTGSRASFRTWQMDAIRSLGREIQLLAPACEDNGSRPDNSEYPWLNAAGRVEIPCRYGFAGIDENDRTFALMITLLRAAAQRYAVSS